MHTLRIFDKLCQVKVRCLNGHNMNLNSLMCLMPGLQVQRVRLVILEALAAGALTAGTRVIETELGAALHVSRTPLREALTALRAEGILEHDGEGLRVRYMGWRDITDLYEMRGTLEGMAARLAARQASHAEKAIIKQLSEEELNLMSQDAPSSTLAQHNKRFHQAILQSANNAFLTEALTKLSRLTILLGSTVYQLPDRRHLITKEHHEIQKPSVQAMQLKQKRP